MLLGTLEEFFNVLLELSCWHFLTWGYNNQVTNEAKYKYSHSIMVKPVRQSTCHYKTKHCVSEECGWPRTQPMCLLVNMRICLVLDEWTSTSLSACHGGLSPDSSSSFTIYNMCYRWISGGVREKISHWQWLFTNDDRYQDNTEKIIPVPRVLPPP